MNWAARGFPWWLPLIVAAICAIAAGALSASASANWEADIRLWVATDQYPVADFADLLSDADVLSAAIERFHSSAMLEAEDSNQSGPIGASDLAGGTQVEIDDTLITVTVQAQSGSDAAALARSLAAAAQDESFARFDEDGVSLELLRSSSTEPRQTAPRTARNASLAAVGGLVLGLLVTAVAARRQPASESATGRVGRIGLRPLALLEPGSERDGAAKPPRSASHLADAIEALGLPATVAFAPISGGVDAERAAQQAARALAGRERRTVWLNTTPPAFVPPPMSEPPQWLAGAPGARPLTRVERIERELKRVGPETDVIVVVTGALSDDPDAVAVGRRASGGVALVADAVATPTQLNAARRQVHPAKVIGVVVDGATQHEARAFDLAFAESDERG